MAAATLDRVPVDEITRRARSARPGHALLTLIGYLIFVPVWCVAKLFRVAWLALAWVYMAADEAWRSAMGTGRPAPDLSALQDEITRLRLELARMS